VELTGAIHGAGPTGAFGVSIGSRQIDREAHSILRIGSG